MPAPASLGRNLRRFRRLQGIKQSHLAEMLGVSQGSVSRWESGVHEPDDAAQERISSLIAARADNRGDAALKRLILSSPLRVHLVCDATHRLLAVSPGRALAWRADAGAYLGTRSGAMPVSKSSRPKESWQQEAGSKDRFRVAVSIPAPMTARPSSSPPA
jgi:transcriptional regulator with XRE-family HTH domain